MPDFDIQKRMEAIKRLRAQGLMEKEIAAKLGITHFALSHFCRKYGVQRVLTGHSLAHVTEAVRLVHSGVPIAEAASRCGTSSKAIEYRLQRDAEGGPRVKAKRRTPKKQKAKVQQVKQTVSVIRAAYITFVNASSAVVWFDDAGNQDRSAYQSDLYQREDRKPLRQTRPGDTVLRGNLRLQVASVTEVRTRNRRKS
jgi:transposase